MSKRAPCMADLQYLGVVSGPTRGQFGDPQLGNGVAVRVLPDGTVRLYMASANPPIILQGDVDIDSLVDGKYPTPKWKSLGSLPCTWSKAWGVFYDARDEAPAIYLTCHSDYDGDAPVAATLSRGRFDADGYLISDGQWAFDRSDKMTDGGVTQLPDGRLGVGFGGYRSVVATGPASMGAALAAFDRPRAPGVIPVQPLLGYPYSKNKVPRMRRPGDNYIQDIGAELENYPTPGPDEIGETTWADWFMQSGVWVETASLSGFLMIWQRGTGRIWYTNTINAEGWQYDLVAYGGEILSGDRPQNDYQPEVDEPFTPPVALPVNGQHADHPGNVITGVSYDERAQILVVGVQNFFGTDAASQATGFLLFKVNDEAPAPENPQFRVTRATVEQQTVEASDAQTAIDIAHANSEGWEFASDSASAEEV
jgi:hypothetical protein